MARKQSKHNKYYPEPLTEEEKEWLLKQERRDIVATIAALVLMLVVLYAIFLMVEGAVKNEL